MEREKILYHAKKIKGFPVAATRMLALTEDPMASAGQVENALKIDPGMTANVLRLANSAYFGRSSEVGSVKEAVVLIGFDKVAQMIITAFLESLMGPKVVGYDLPPGELWRHAMAVAVAADLIDHTIKTRSGGRQFAAALLHDVGKLALGTFVGDKIDLIEEKAASGLSFEAAELSILGTNHTEVGATILEAWNLPVEIVHAARWHHEPEKAPQIDPQTDLTLDIVHIADIISLMIGVGTGREGLQYVPDPGSAGRLNLNAKKIEWVASETLQKMEALTRTFETRNDKG